MNSGSLNRNQICGGYYDQKILKTRKGTLTFPCYIPVTTFGDKYPLDNLIRPYLPRLAQAVMVSHFYARQMKEDETAIRIPMLVDSGGFVSLFADAKVRETGGLGVIELERDGQLQVTNPQDVLEFQEKVADIAFTLDFPIPPGTETNEASSRLKLTVANALWAIKNRRRRDMPLYACVQGFDAASARECVQAYKGARFDGLAIGGLVPRSGDRKLVQEIVEAVRNEDDSIPLHVFGLGSPDMVELLYSMGVDSVDSSSYVRLAAEGRSWSSSEKVIDPSPTGRLSLALSNLAYAAQTTLPLSATRLIFTGMHKAEARGSSAHQGGINR